MNTPKSVTEKFTKQEIDLCRWLGRELSNIDDEINGNKILKENLEAWNMEVTYPNLCLAKRLIETYWGVKQ